MLPIEQLYIELGPYTLHISVILREIVSRTGSKNKISTYNYLEDKVFFAKSRAIHISKII